jgi:flagellin-like protein
LKGISPLIASVLLIAFTLAAATIIGAWMTSTMKSSTDTVGGQLTSNVNCSSNVINLDVLCHNNNNVTVIVQNIGSASLTNPSFYMKTSDETTCISNQTDTISVGGFAKYEINCTNFAVNKTLNYVKVTALCQGVVSISIEKKDFTDSCS